MEPWPSSSPELARLRAWLNRLPGVTGTACGIRPDDRGRTPTPSLLVFVSRKRPLSRLARSEWIPPQWRASDGHRLPIAVIDNGNWCATHGAAVGGDPEYSRRLRPYRAGYSFGLKRRAGTLGLVVEPADQPGHPWLLSSSHVFNLRADGRRWSLYQPSGPDREDEPPVARAARFTLLHPRQPNTSEAAIAEPVRCGDIDPTHPGGALQGLARALSPGQTLTKIGRSSGAVRGRVVATDWSGRVRFGRATYTFARQLLIAGDNGEAVSLLGDSGSVWLTEDRYVAALNFGGNGAGNLSVSTPLSRIFDLFHLQLPAAAMGPPNEVV